MAFCLPHILAVVLAVFLAACFPIAAVQPTDDLPSQVRELREQNRLLQQQLQRQQELIDDLSARVGRQEAAVERNGMEEEMPSAGQGFLQRFGGGGVTLTGEGAVGVYESSANGAFPNSEFRVGEERLFLDARLAEDAYFFTELNLTHRDTDKERVELGELYVDFENLSRFFNRDRLVSLRVGRFDLPFGQEYLTRDAIDNPLISRSLNDIWGVDEGVELYGSAGKLSYILAVQNGGHPLLRDYDSDKAVIGKLSYQAARWANLSVSAMRTGDLTTAGDALSEIWFGGGFIRGIDPGATTFWAEMYQGDVEFLIPRGHLKFWGGYLHSDDNGPLNASERDVYYYGVEALQNITRKFYAASRFSQILAEDGLPIVGLGAFGPFMFNNANLTEELWRLSLGVGYRIRQNLVIKTEFSVEQGEMIGGRPRKTNMIGAEVAFGF